MRLLPKSEVQETKRREKDDLEKERASVAEAVNKEIRRLNDIKDSRNKEIEKIESHFLNEKKTLEEKRESLVSEVVSLERRKIEALRPIADRIATLEKKEKELISLGELLKEKKTELDEERAVLAEMKSEISEERCELQDQKRVLAQKESTNKVNQGYIAAMTAELNKAWENYHREVKRKTEELGEATYKVSVDKAATEADRKWVEDEKNRLSLERIRMNSQQDSLKDAFDIARQKGII